MYTYGQIFCTFSLSDILKGDSIDDNVVIFVNSAQEADSLGSLLESQCIGVLKATEFIPPTELKDLRANWNHVVETRKPTEFVLGELKLGPSIPHLVLLQCFN